MNQQDLFEDEENRLPTLCITQTVLNAHESMEEVHYCSFTLTFIKNYHFYQV